MRTNANSNPEPAVALGDCVPSAARRLLLLRGYGFAQRHHG